MIISSPDIELLYESCLIELGDSVMTILAMWCRLASDNYGNTLDKTEKWEFNNHERLEAKGLGVCVQLTGVAYERDLWHQMVK